MHGDTKRCSRWNHVIAACTKVNFAEQMCGDRRNVSPRRQRRLGSDEWDVMTKVKPGSVTRSPEPARYKKIDTEGSKAAAAAWCE